MINEVTAKRVLEAALSRVGDFAEIFLEDTEKNTVQLIDSKIDSSNYSRIVGAGVRVIEGTVSAYAYTNDISEKGLIEAAIKAQAALRNKIRGDIKIEALNGFDYSVNRNILKLNPDFASSILKRADAAARSVSTEISQVSSLILNVDQRVQICNSEGVFSFDRRPRTRFVVSAVAASGNEMQTGMEGPGFAMGQEAFERIDVEKASITAAKRAVTMLHAPECPPKVMSVVMDGGFGGVIFHEACGHSLEATSVAKGNSVFCNKLGQQIASKKVTAIDDGTIPGEWGTLNIDDEGNKTQRNVLIENGILKSYLVDKLGARIMGCSVTGSSRRESYKYAPTSRMNNTYIAAGNDDPEEMISSMEEGLYAKSMGGGSVNPLTGEFNFAVSEGYYVKNGKIITPVRSATLIGKGKDVLMNIDRVGKEMWMAQGMCGSVSGSVATNVGQPRIRVQGLTVGGKGKEIR